MVNILDSIGEDGLNFIIFHEVSSEQNYKKNLQHPVWPGPTSGVTIGIGYDLGFKSRAQFELDWEKLSKTSKKALLSCVGIRGLSAQRKLEQYNVKRAFIPYDIAVKVFKDISLKRTYEELKKHFENFDALPSKCATAIMSLTFNRGPSFDGKGDRYSEMRDIKKALNSENFEEIPGLLRKMKRLWIDKKASGLLLRREREAQLFEEGLVSLKRPRRKFSFL